METAVTVQLSADYLLQWKQKGLRHAVTSIRNAGYVCDGNLNFAHCIHCGRERTGSTFNLLKVVGKHQGRRQKHETASVLLKKTSTLTLTVRALIYRT